MPQRFHYQSLRDVGIFDGRDYFDSQIHLLLMQSNLTDVSRSRILEALNESYNAYVEYLSLNDPELPEDLTWSQLKLIRMGLDELNRERDYRLADSFCREVAPQIIARVIAECKKLGIQTRKKKPS